MTKRQRTVDVNEISNEIKSELCIDIDVNDDGCFNFLSLSLNNDELHTILILLLKKSNGNSCKMINWELIPADLKHKRNIIISYVKQTPSYVISDKLFYGLKITPQEQRQFKVYLAKAYIKSFCTNISEIEFSTLYDLDVKELTSIIVSAPLFYRPAINWKSLTLQPEEITLLFESVGWVSYDILTKLGIEEKAIKACQTSVLAKSLNNITDMLTNINWKLVAWSESVDKQLLTSIIGRDISIDKIPICYFIQSPVSTFRDVLMFMGKIGDKRGMNKLESWHEIMAHCTPALRTTSLMVAATVYNQYPVLNVYFQNLMDWEIVQSTPETQQNIMLNAYKHPELFNTLPIDPIYGSGENAVNVWKRLVKDRQKLIILFPFLPTVIDFYDLRDILQPMLRKNPSCIKDIENMDLTNECYFMLWKIIVHINVDYVRRIKWKSLSEKQTVYFIQQCCVEANVKLLSGIDAEILNKGIIEGAIDHIKIPEDVLEISKLNIKLDFNVARKLLLKQIELNKGPRKVCVEMLYNLNIETDVRVQLIKEVIQALRDTGVTPLVLKEHMRSMVPYNITKLSFSEYCDIHSFGGSLPGVFYQAFITCEQTQDSCCYAIKLHAAYAKRITFNLTCDDILENNSNAFLYYEKAQQLIKENQQKVIKAIIKDKEEDTSCTICYEEFEVTKEPYLYTKCLHPFCLSCIKLWLREHDTCPACRKKIE